MQPSRRVRQDHIFVVGPSILYGIKDHRGRIAAGLVLYHLQAQVIAVHLQLLYGPGSEGVTCRQNHGVVLVHEVSGHLGDAGGLARAVYPYEEYLDRLFLGLNELIKVQMVLG